MNRESDSTLAPRIPTPVMMFRYAAWRTSRQSWAKAIVPHHTAQPTNQAATMIESMELSSHGQRVVANSGSRMSRAPNIASSAASSIRKRTKPRCIGTASGAGAERSERPIEK